MIESDGSPEPYLPQPIETANVHLPSDIERLITVLAENTHAVWARARLGEGWRFGAQRDDTRRLHPSLVRFAQLPESEREYDLLVVREALKVLVSMGYSLEKR